MIHSLRRLRDAARRRSPLERAVPHTSMAALAGAAANHADRRVVGATVDCLLSVLPAALSRLEVLLVGFEANTPQPLGDTYDAGFELAGERELVDHVVREAS